MFQPQRVRRFFKQPALIWMLSVRPLAFGFNAVVCYRFKGFRGERRICNSLLGFMLLVSLWAGALSAQAQPVSWKEDTRWLTRSTEHFEISYPEQLEAMALHSLEIAERVHQELLPFFGSAPELPTRMLLVDDFDFSNGWATPLPYPQIRLFASPPQADSGLSHYDDWLHLLIRHEYVHILHMEMSRGTVAKSRDLFGRWLFGFPHALTPSMILEGLAVYLETNKTLGYGRLDSSLFAMQMRAEVASGFDDYRQVLAATRDWPFGKVYLYGAYFVDFLVRTRGEAALKRYLTYYSGKIVPYAQWNQSLRVAFGAPISILWEEFRADMTERFPPIEREPMVVAGENLSAVVGRQQVLASTPGGDLLSFQSSGEDRAEVVLYRASDDFAAPASSEFKTTSVTDIATSNSGITAYSRRIARASGAVLSELFVRDLKGKTRRVGENTRARQISWLPGGERLIFGRIRSGISELMWANLDGEIEPLWVGEKGEVLAGFDVHPDGERLVASIKRANRGWNLEILDLTSLQWSSVTQSRATEMSPRWQGRSHLVYSADYSGVFNLYRLDLAAGRLEQLTDTPTGNFTPIPVKGGIVYQQYTASGYQLKRLSDEQLAINRQAIAKSQATGSASSKPVPLNQYLMGGYQYPDYASSSSRVPVQIGTAGNYRAIDTVGPTSWFPMWALTEHQIELGFSTFGSDALGRHSYTLGSSYNAKHGVLNLNLAYFYDTRWTIGATRSHSYALYRVAGRSSEDTRIERDDSLLLQRSHLFNAFEDKMSLHAGLIHDQTSVVKGEPERFSQTQGLAGLALTFDNRQLHIHTPGIGYGSYAFASWETNDLLDSDYEGSIHQAGWQHTFDLSGRHGLTIAATAGWADDTAKPFSLGGLEDEQGLFGRDRIALPGYESSTQSGQNLHREALHWQLWLGRVEQGWRTLPLGLADYSLRLSGYGGAAWNTGEKADWLPSLEATLNTEVILGYRFILPVSLGLARGLDESGTTQGVLRFNWFF